MRQEINQQQASTAKAIWQLMRMDKPYGTLLLFWPCFWGLALASERLPDVSSVVIFFFGSIFMRACGCVINDIADQDIDSKVTRTQHRPLASGQLTTRSAIVVFILLASLALSLCLLLSPINRILAVFGFLLACLYPFAKRWMACPQIILGCAFAWGVPMAYIHQHGNISATVCVLYIAVVIWTFAYDTIYALQDIKDDKKIGIGSAALWLGQNVFIVIQLSYIIFFGLLCLAGILEGLNMVYYLACIVVGMVLIGQIHHIQQKNSQAFFQAFCANQWIGPIIGLGIIVAKRLH